MGRQNKVLLRTICLPEREPLSGSSCFTSGINKDSKVIDPVQLNLFNHTYCDKHRVGFDKPLKFVHGAFMGTIYFRKIWLQNRIGDFDKVFIPPG